MTERLKSCCKCSPTTEEIFCVENKGLRHKYIIHEDSAPTIMDSPIDDCDTLKVIEDLEIRQTYGQK